MGARGPLAMPDNVRQLRGNPGKRETPRTIRPVTAIPRAPAWKPAEADGAQAEWDRITPELERLGVLARIDGATLEVHCRAVARLKDCEDIGSPYGKRLAALIVMTSKELGLTYSARSRMKAPEIEPPMDPKSGLD